MAKEIFCDEPPRELIESMKSLLSWPKSVRFANEFFEQGQKVLSLIWFFDPKKSILMHAPNSITYVSYFKDGLYDDMIAFHIDRNLEEVNPCYFTQILDEEGFAINLGRKRGYQRSKLTELSYLAERIERGFIGNILYTFQRTPFTVTIKAGGKTQFYKL